MWQEIIAYAIIAAVVGWAIWRIFFKKERGCACSSSSAGCGSCPYCSGKTKDKSKCIK